MAGFSPDYSNVEKAARNIEAPRLPLYEHIICNEIMEGALNKPFASLYSGNFQDKVEYFRNYCGFFREMGYDTASFEACITAIIPDGGALGRHMPGAIKSRADFDRYPWKEIPELYKKAFRDDFLALREAMPEGMKAVGGVGNGVFEFVQDLTGYTDLCYIGADDPELYSELFSAAGDVSVKIWEWVLKEFGDIYCVCRFGDDMGFKSTTLISDDDLRSNVFPQYKRIVDLVHRYGKPFLLHSCGNIFIVMEDLIDGVGIDAKHSNEDEIAKFPVWVDKYGDRIGNFGGIDTDAVCRLGREEMREYINEVIPQCIGRGGFAFGSGNSIPSYVPLDGYLSMVEIVRESRGDYKR